MCKVGGKVDKCSVCTRWVEGDQVLCMCRVDGKVTRCSVCARQTSVVCMESMWENHQM